MSRIVWDKLLNFESRALVARELECRYPGSGRAKEMAAEITAAFRQARSYFNSAADADSGIKPLLLYYGVLGLARGLILFTGHKRREANLDQRHGLSAKGWAAQLVGDAGIEALKVTVDKAGTFRELVESIENSSLNKFYSSGVEWRCVHVKLPEEPFEICFGDLLIRTPAVEAFVQRWLQQPPRFVVIERAGKGEQDGWGSLVIRCPEAQLQLLPAIFRDITHRFGTPAGNVMDVAFVDDANPAPYIWTEITHFGMIGSGFKVEPLGDVQVCQIGALHVMAYVLGMLARYHPSVWTALIRNEKFDGGLPTVQALIRHIEERFPEMILEFLERRDAPK